MDTREIFNKCLRIHTLGKQLDEVQTLLNKLERNGAIAIRVYTDAKDSTDSGFYVNYGLSQMRGAVKEIANIQLEAIATEIRNVASSLS